MSLHEIMVNRPCIWILKELYESEASNKKAYAAKGADIQKYLNISNPGIFVAILEKDGLVHVDSVEDDIIVSLSKKGKDFFKLFDKLKNLTESQVKIIEDRPSAKVEYNLTNKEKKTLFSVYRTVQDPGKYVPLSHIGKQPEIVLNKLQKLNLISKVKKGQGVSVALTPSGKKAVQKEFSEKLKK